MFPKRQIDVVLHLLVLATTQIGKTLQKDSLRFDAVSCHFVPCLAIGAGDSSDKSEIVFSIRPCSDSLDRATLEPRAHWQHHPVHRVHQRLLRALKRTADEPVSDVRLLFAAKKYAVSGVECPSRATNLLVVSDDGSRGLIMNNERRACRSPSLARWWQRVP